VAGPGGSQTIMSGIKIPRSYTQDRDVSFYMLDFAIGHISLPSPDGFFDLFDPP